MFLVVWEKCVSACMRATIDTYTSLDITGCKKRIYLPLSWECTEKDTKPTGDQRERERRRKQRKKGGSKNSNQNTEDPFLFQQ